MQDITLKNFDKNTKAVVMRITVAGELARRMRAIGLFTGAHIEVMNRPWFNDSIVVKVDGCLLVMKKKEADCVIVKAIRHENAR